MEGGRPDARDRVTIPCLQHAGVPFALCTPSLFHPFHAVVTGAASGLSTRVWCVPRGSQRSLYVYQSAESGGRAWTRRQGTSMLADGAG